jgi:hypothetical protein
MMLLSYKTFPSGGQVPTLPPPTSYPLIPNGPFPPPGLPAPDPVTDNSPSPPVTYQFKFWVINGVLNKNNPAQFLVPDTDFDATAWYIQVGVGPETGVWTYAFSVNKNEVIPNATPIASVSMPGAWPVPGKPNTFVAVSASPVGITAVPLVTPYGKFKEWFQLWGELAISGSNRTMTAPANSGNGAVAFYAIPVPDPCQDIRDLYQSINRLDFQTEAEYVAAKKKLFEQLVACEEKYGETNLPRK